MKLKLTVFLVIASLFATGAFSIAAADSWEKLGEKRVSLSAERDIIWVGASDGRYKKLKIMVKDAAVEFQEAKVIFSIGSEFDLALRDKIEAGGESRQIDLPGLSRTIRKIEFRYKSSSGKLKRAKVSVWGLKD